LEIINTNIDGGLEYLPDSLENFYCAMSRNELNAKVKNIFEQLRNYGEEGKYNLKS